MPYIPLVYQLSWNSVPAGSSLLGSKVANWDGIFKMMGCVQHVVPLKSPLNLHLSTWHKFRERKKVSPSLILKTSLKVPVLCVHSGELLQVPVEYFP